MAGSVHRTILTFVRAILLFYVLNTGIICGASIFHGIRVATRANSMRTRNHFNCSESVFDLSNRLVVDADYQRNISSAFLAADMGLEPFHHLMDRSKLAFANSLQRQSLFATEAFGLIVDKTSAITSSPSFPHFVAGITAG
jgi:hypothetical protein